MNAPTIADKLITESVDLMPHQVAERLRAAIRNAATWDEIPVSVALVAMACRFLIGDVTPSSDVEPDDTELIDCYVEAFGGTHAQAVQRLKRFAGEVPA